MHIEPRIPLLDELLDAWDDKTGADHAAYRNHCYRMLHFCFALHTSDEDSRRKFIIAAAFHDLGLWESGSIDYLPPSVALAQRYLEQNGLQHWSPEIGAMIDQHHKLRPWRGGGSALVEVFRRADLVDVSLGRVRFGLVKADVDRVRREFPNAGFHKRLVQLAGGWFSKHPLSPPPFIRW